MKRNLVGFDIYFIPYECAIPVCITASVAATLDICANGKTEIVRIVPVYELPSVSEPESKE